MLWSSGNLQAQLDFDTRGPHVAALAGKAITERYYGKAYFFGCSNGGTQALAEAQRFPWDFDGIVDLAGVPSYSSKLEMRLDLGGGVLLHVVRG